MKRHIGTTVAIMVGLFSMMAGLNNITTNKPDSNLLVGIVMVLGGLACRSAKKRYLAEAKNTHLRKIGEAALLVVLLAVVFLQNNLWVRMAYQPIPYIVAPAWTLIAYAVSAFKKQKLLS